MDAGPSGLGLVLKVPEGWKAVDCASGSLTEVEKWYPQIDHGALVICWACERCYLYLVGSSFVTEADHRPLLPLFNNPHSRPPMRIECWLLYLQQFDFELKYCPRSENGAHYLSRHMIPLTESVTEPLTRENRLYIVSSRHSTPSQLTCGSSRCNEEGLRAQQAHPTRPGWQS